MKVLILGCGPAGLMACHAAAMSGHDVIVVSKARKSHMRGAQYLHMPIPLDYVPELTGEIVESDVPVVSMAGQRYWHTTATAFTIDYQLQGSSEDYAQKVYPGTGPNRPKVSPEDLVGKHAAWDIRETYDWLWDTYGDYVFHRDFGDPSLVDETLSWAKADHAISTIPAPLLCLEGHTFTHASIWSSDREVVPLADNTVLCNGEVAPAWYRAARIQGWNTVEWPEANRPPIPDLFDVKKPIRTNCTCFHDVVRMGRYGKWAKGVLSHEAFYETLELLNGETRGTYAPQRTGPVQSAND